LRLYVKDRASLVEKTDVESPLLMLATVSTVVKFIASVMSIPTIPKAMYSMAVSQTRQSWPAKALHLLPTINKSRAGAM
jgi:hypothetical protein